MAISNLNFVARNISLGPSTWYGLGGAAEYLATPRSVAELATLVRLCGEEGIPLRVLGGGTNLLISDNGVEGVVTRLSSPAFDRTNFVGSHVTAGAGGRLEALIARTVRLGLGGLEGLTGIPGTIGGALRGNSGTRLGEIASRVTRVALMDAAGKIVVRERSDIAYGYRRSDLHGIILAGQFQLEPEDSGILAARRRSNWRQKKERQPMGARSAGCVFKNPPEIPAGELIEQAGWKGVKVGGARVSDLHANFIIADRDATTHDIFRLIDMIRTSISERFGIGLDPEIDCW
ncbi:MAG: UDP-N-acetylmuramate dehydrogenase [Isosphaeraceae bacterium]